MAVQDFVVWIGQSNSQPTAVYASWTLLHPELDITPLSTVSPPANGVFTLPILTISGVPTPFPVPAPNIYGLALEQIRFLTFYNPEAAPGTFVSDALAPSEFGSWAKYGLWLPWCAIENSVGGASKTNPFPAGFRYPSHWTAPIGPIYPPVQAYPILIGSSVGFAALLHNALGSKIHVLNLGINAVPLADSEIPIAGTGPGGVKWGWHDPKVGNTWSPGRKGGLYSRLVDSLDTARKAAALNGDTLRCRAVVFQQGETDALNAEWANRYYDNLEQFVRMVRQAIVTAGCFDASPEWIPWIQPNIGSVWTYRDAINSALKRMAADDHRFVTFSVDGFEKIDTAHYNHNGVFSMERALYDAWKLAGGGSLPTPDDLDVPTLALMRSRVRLISERQTVTNDQDTDATNQAINDALREFYSDIGDTAWWLRRVDTFALSSDNITPVLMPRVVRRLLQVFDSADLDNPVGFSLINHTDRGRMRVRLFNTLTGTRNYEVHHMLEPREMRLDGDRPLLPLEYLEAVCVGAARRLTEGSGNAKLEAKLLRREGVAWEKARAHASKMDRARNQRFYHPNSPKRRLPRGAF